jgi:hypothetical protein
LRELDGVDGPEVPPAAVEVVEPREVDLRIFW